MQHETNFHLWQLGWPLVEHTAGAPLGGERVPGGRRGVEMVTAGELHLARDRVLLIHNITSCKQATKVCDILESESDKMKCLLRQETLVRVSESGQIPNSPTAQEMLAAVWAWASTSSLRPKASLVSGVQDLAPMFHLMVPTGSGDRDEHQHVSAMMLGQKIHSSEQTVPVTQREIRDYIEHVKTIRVTIPEAVKTLLRKYFLASRRIRFNFPQLALEALLR